VVVENEAGLAPELLWTVLEKNLSVCAEKQTMGRNQFTLQVTLYHLLSFVNNIILNINFLFLQRKFLINCTVVF
jgi:hypothetical protein